MKPAASGLVLRFLGAMALLPVAACQGGPPTGKLTLGTPAIDAKTGTVMINGVDTNQPDTPFTWSWGDGKMDKSFFPATHTYKDRTTNYTVTVTAHYSGNYTATAKTVVSFQ